MREAAICTPCVETFILNILSETGGIRPLFHRITTECEIELKMFDINSDVNKFLDCI